MLARDESRRGGGGFFGPTLIVEHLHLQLATFDSTLGVELVDGELDPVGAGETERRFRASHAADFADDDGAVRIGRRRATALVLLLARGERREGEEAQKKPAHGGSSSFDW